MTLAHRQELAPPVETALHRLAPECKVLATFAFVLAVALVPTGTWWPLGLDLLLLAAIAAWSRTPPRTLAARLAVEIPFVLFVVVLPFAADGPRVDVLGIGLAVVGLETAGAIVAKASLAVLATGVLTATTPAPAILAGAERLRVPRTFTAVAAFAVRYVQVVLEELRRLQLARVARGDDPRWLWQARAVAQCSGALAVRCFERGERVHTAMLARCFDGRLPDLSSDEPARAGSWALALLAPAVAIAATAVAHGGVA
jgi:cobalt/nickel transport system permease protein